MYKLQPDSVTVLLRHSIESVIDSLRQIVMVPVRILVSLLWCTYKEGRQRD